MSDSPSKPTMLYDGDCGFCRKWIGRWKALTGPRVEYAPYQEAADRFPHIPQAAFPQAVQFIEPNGAVTSGAEAVFKSLATVPTLRWMLFLYRWMPLFGWGSRVLYRFVARHRRGFSTLTSWLWGRELEPSTFLLSRRLFLRMVGMIYGIAFSSLAVQILGLVGSRGIVPLADYLPRVRQHFGGDAYWRFPTLAWYDPGDAFLQFLCVGGAVMGALVFLGLAPLPFLLLCWVFYLSVTNAGQVFMHFQWDILLLEVGFLAIFFAPLSWRLGSPRAAPPSRTVRWLVQWLLVRLMLLSGLVKLTAGDDCWWNLTALTYHYQTQPIPTWTAWYAHHLPLWFQKCSCALMFIAELGAPLLLFGPRRIRHAACAMIVGLMALIGVTGNYNFFNLLTVALCIPCLDDALLRRLVPERMRSWIVDPQPRQRRRIGRGIVVALLALYIVPASLIEVYRGVVRRPLPWEWANTVFSALDPLRITNSYGLFRVMTKSRPEIVVEGSKDGQSWVEYEFQWKPGDLKRAPGFVEPHQPRLDWQMWFAALGRYEQNPWVAAFLRRLLDGSPSVLALFEKNPFPDAPPKYVRATLYDYRFTDPETKSKTGAWWRRERIRAYAPPVGLNRR